MYFYTIISISKLFYLAHVVKCSILLLDWSKNREWVIHFNFFTFCFVVCDGKMSLYACRTCRVRSSTCRTCGKKISLHSATSYAFVWFLCCARSHRWQRRWQRMWLVEWGKIRVLHEWHVLMTRIPCHLLRNNNVKLSHLWFWRQFPHSTLNINSVECTVVKL